jgi:hypothetical protein
MVRTTVTPLTNPPTPCYDYGVIERDGRMTTAQRMERAFYIQFIQLVNEVQGVKYQKLPSQVYSRRGSTWVKQTQNPRQKKDALSLV